MSEADVKQTLAISEIPRTRSERFISVYANHLEAAAGFYDLGLLFCHIAKDPQGKPVSEQLAEITLAWEHALRFRDLLDRLVQAYERDHGKIRSMKEPQIPQDNHPPQEIEQSQG